jgi:allantoinase
MMGTAIAEAMVERDWDFMSHGIYNTRYLYGYSEEQERAFYQDCIETLQRHTGKQLKGMRGPAISGTERTPDLMAEAGLIYHTDWMHDDQPVPIKVKSGLLSFN